MRPFNFAAGPAALPVEVLQQAADEMLDWQGTGTSVMEMSHRSREFESIHQTALADLAELLMLPANYRLLFFARRSACRKCLGPIKSAGRAHSGGLCGDGYMVA